MFGVFFASDPNDTPWVVQSPESEDYGCRNSDFSFVDTVLARNQLHKFNVLKPVGLEGSHPSILKELSML